MRISLAWLISAALGLGACSPVTPPTATEGPLSVVAAETFLADIAQNVAGNRVTVQSLLPAGVDPHEYQLTPQDAIALTQSKVLIVNGQGYEPWLMRYEPEGNRGPLQVEASTGLAGQEDPHLWMSPLNVVTYTENIRDGLSQADPQGSSTYAANASAYIQELRDLDAWIRVQVAQIPSERRLLVTNHFALGSFAKEYGFVVVGTVIPSSSDEAAPSAQEMAALSRTIESSGAPAIFLGVSENDQLAQQVAAESGAGVVAGLYVETLSETNGPAPTYVEMMKFDVRLIVETLK
jgi:ABC-type Zn uptake system ZnuABC Zn-binding protein ZnuA